MNISHEQYVAIFNEWAERYTQDPTDFGKVLDDKGNVVSDYGERCALYFSVLADEMNIR